MYDLNTISEQHDLKTLMSRASRTSAHDFRNHDLGFNDFGTIDFPTSISAAHDFGNTTSGHCICGRRFKILRPQSTISQTRDFPVNDDLGSRIKHVIWAYGFKHAGFLGHAFLESVLDRKAHGSPKFTISINTT